MIRKHEFCVCQQSFSSVKTKVLFSSGFVYKTRGIEKLNTSNRMKCNRFCLYIDICVSFPFC